MDTANTWMGDCRGRREEQGRGPPEREPGATGRSGAPARALAATACAPDSGSATTLREYTF